MNNSSMLQHHTWHPFSYLGINKPILTLQADILISTWIILGLIFALSLYIFRCLQNENSLVRWVVLQYVKAFADLLHQSLKSCPLEHLAMIGSLFSFIFICNTIQFIPWLEEPTSNLNTTFALGLISFFYVHSSSIKTKGLKHYILHYFQPFVFMFPLHIIGIFSSIISISFRLFGNIYGGFIISSLYHKAVSGSVIAQTIGLLSGADLNVFLIFGIFEGLIQAFVFTMLTLTYLSMEIAPEDISESNTLNITP
jgi:F-type H+-transporting ATPase subunit a